MPCVRPDPLRDWQPGFKKATLRLNNGKTFCIKADNNSPQNVYIQSAQLNGQPLNEYTFDHAAIVAGGELDFSMGNQPQKAWAAADPAGFKTQTLVSAIPYLTRVSDKFLGACRVEMKCDDPRRRSIIRWMVQRRLPAPRGSPPFEITNSTTLKLRSFTPGSAPSIVSLAR